MPLIPNESPNVSFIKKQQTQNIILPNGLEPNKKEVILIHDNTNTLLNSINILNDSTYTYTSSLNINDITKGFFGISDTNFSGSDLNLYIHEHSIYGENIDFVLNVFSGSVNPILGYIKIKNSTAFEDYVSYSISDLSKTGSVWNINIDTINQSQSFITKNNRVIFDFFNNVNDIIIPFTGNRNVTRKNINGELIISGSQNLQSSDVVTFLDNYFFPYSPTDITLYSHSMNLVETGSTVNYNLTVNIQNNSDTIFASGSLYANNVAIANYSSSNDTTITYVDSSVSQNTTYKYSLLSGTGSDFFNTITSNEISLTFEYPILWCFSQSKITNVSDIYTNAKLNNTYTIYNDFPVEHEIMLSGSNGYFYIAIPYTNKNLTVKDEHGFVIHSDNQINWTDLSDSITSNNLPNDWSYSYKIIESNFTSIDAIWKIIIE